MGLFEHVSHWPTRRGHVCLSTDSFSLHSGSDRLLENLFFHLWNRLGLACSWKCGPGLELWGLWIRGSHIHAYVFWLLVLCGFVSVAFGFTARSPIIALMAFATATAASVLLTPLLHYRLFRSVRQWVLGDKS
jgi:hypothetical protein